MQIVHWLEFSPLINWNGEPAEGNALAGATYQECIGVGVGHSTYKDNGLDGYF